MIELSVGTPVTVKKLRQTGVITAVLSGRRLRVLIGSLSITCGRDEVDPVPASKKGAKPRKASTPLRLKRPPGAPPSSTLDLHGLTVAEATRKLESWLDRVILADLSHVKVIHGLGSGKIQRAVHDSLAAISAVRHFQVNNSNPGETDIYL
jgi:DNA mismatch repair protein MutS2